MKHDNALTNERAIEDSGDSLFAFDSKGALKSEVQQK
jgi:hypothetical protein